MALEGGMWDGHVRVVRDRDGVELPPVMCARLADHEWERQTVLVALHDWLDSESNLLVISGRAGTGKSWTLRHAQDVTARRIDRSAIYDFDRVRDDVAGKCPGYGNAETGGPYILIDNFDAINSIAYEQTPPPDLRDLSDLLHQGHRVVVTTRRSRLDASDELTRQLATHLRWSALGARRPTLVQLLPWTQGELAAHVSLGDLGPLNSVVEYLGAYDEVVSEDLRSPLGILMLSQLALDRLSLKEPLSLARLYDEYVDWALTIDYDRRQSAFHGTHKRGILANIAYDILSGQTGVGTTAHSIPHSRLAERVMEAVAQDVALRSSNGARNYEWTQDFISTNPFLEGRDHAFPLGRRDYEFANPSFFEYFVAQAIVVRIASGSSLGVRPEALSEATFRSMTLYFVREYWSADLEAAIGTIARRRLSWPDRLLLLYTMETTDSFGDLLQRIEPTYFEDLVGALPSVKSHFIRKVIRYQLVVVERHSPYEYVADLRESESDGEIAAERWLLRFGDPDVTTALVRRLELPALLAARPIAVYRLGQMGSEEALPPLREIAERSSSHPMLRQLALEAIVKIEGRAVRADGGA